MKLYLILLNALMPISFVACDAQPNPPRARQAMDASASHPDSDRKGAAYLFVENYVLRSQLEADRSRDARLVIAKKSVESIADDIQEVLHNPPTTDVKYYLEHDPQHWDAYFKRAEALLTASEVRIPKVLRNPFAARLDAERKAYRASNAFYQSLLTYRESILHAFTSPYPGPDETMRTMTQAYEICIETAKSAAEAGEKWNTATDAFQSQHPDIINEALREVASRRSSANLP